MNDRQIRVEAELSHLRQKNKELEKRNDDTQNQPMASRLILFLSDVMNSWIDH
jgi:hypothetical protein